MTLLWLVTGASLLVALVALSQARRASARLEQISRMYWELKYQNAEFRGQLERMAGGALPPPATPNAPGRPPVDGFVPITSIKR